MDIERTKFIKMMLSRCRALKDSAVRTLNDTSVKESTQHLKLMPKNIQILYI